MTPDKRPTTLATPPVKDTSPQGFDFARLFKDSQCSYKNYQIFLLQYDQEIFKTPAIIIIDPLVNTILNNQPDDLTLNNLRVSKNLGLLTVKFLNNQIDPNYPNQFDKVIKEKMIKIAEKTNVIKEAIEDRSTSQPKTPADYIKAATDNCDHLHSYGEISLLQELRQFPIEDFDESSCRRTIRLGESVLRTIKADTKVHLNEYCNTVDTLITNLTERLLEISSVTKISQKLFQKSLDPNQAIEDIRKIEYPGLINKELLHLWQLFTDIPLDQLDKNSIYYLDSIGNRVSQLYAEADKQELKSQTDARIQLIEEVKQKIPLKSEEKSAPRLFDPSI